MVKIVVSIEPVLQGQIGEYVRRLRDVDLSDGVVQHGVAGPGGAEARAGAGTAGGRTLGGRSMGGRTERRRAHRHELLGLGQATQAADQAQRHDEKDRSSSLD